MGKGWYILVGVTALLIVALLGFAAFMTFQSHQALCADHAVACGAPHS